MKAILNVSQRLLPNAEPTQRNEKYEIEIVPNVNHAFIDLETRKFVPFENIAIEWILGMYGKK